MHVSLEWKGCVVVVVAVVGGGEIEEEETYKGVKMSASILCQKV
jgi:hypothetical protein